MTIANDHDIKVLNGLLEAVLDSVDGYREAARETDQTRCRGLFEQRAEERGRVAADLQAAVRGLGGEPDHEGSILAKAHRAFLDIKHALLRDDQSVVASVESGEDHLKARFDRALEDERISATTRDVIRRAYVSVRQGHDEMRALKHSLEGQRDASSGLYPQ